MSVSPPPRQQEIRPTARDKETKSLVNGSVPTISCLVWLCDTGPCNTNLILPAIFPYQFSTELPIPGSGKVKTQIFSNARVCLEPCLQAPQPQHPPSFQAALSYCPPSRKPKAKKYPSCHLPFSHFSEGNLMLEK